MGGVGVALHVLPGTIVVVTIHVDGLCYGHIWWPLVI